MSASRNAVASNTIGIYTELHRLTSDPRESGASVLNGVNRSETSIDGEWGCAASAQAVIDGYGDHAARGEFLCPFKNPGSISEIPCAAVE
jgi:hypothetical protein